MHEWKARQVQIVWFTADGVNRDASTIFLGLTGQNPNSVNRSKTPQLPAAEIVVAQGEGGTDWAAVVQTQPGRVDFFAVPLVQSVDPEPSTFQTFEGVLHELLGRVFAVSEQLGMTNRVSIVGTFASQEPDLATANAHFGMLIGLEIPGSPAEAGDLNFVVNLRATIQAAERSFLVNRVCRWSVEVGQQLLFEMPDLQGVSGQTLVPKVTSSYFTVVQADINLLPLGIPLTPAHGAEALVGLRDQLLKTWQEPSLAGLSNG